MIRQAYSEGDLGCDAVFKWHIHFAQGRDNLGDEEDTSPPRMVRTVLKIQQVVMLVFANRSQMVGEEVAAAAAAESWYFQQNSVL
jgi:hypothetical protein